MIKILDIDIDIENCLTTLELNELCLHEETAKLRKLKKSMKKQRKRVKEYKAIVENCKANEKELDEEDLLCTQQP